MISELFTYIFLILGVFIPIVIWAYMFCFIDGSSLNRKRFLYGICAGGIATLPVIYLEKFTDILQIPFLNVFETVYFLSSPFSYFLFPFF